MTRYGIGEWYGLALDTLAPADRRVTAEHALDTKPTPPLCPYAAKPCSKKGGVCTLQQYRKDGAAVGAPVIVCPTRFEQGGLLVHWLADIVGFDPGHVHVAPEVPFMADTNTGRPAGRIDLVVAETDGGLSWFGLEVQAVYFSGSGMGAEFERLRTATGSRPYYPDAVRRPDWRSSSAKRLMPQLMVKGPTLRRWGSKIAVAVDAPFFAAIGGPSSEPSQDINDGDVVWMVPELRDGKLTRGHWEVLTLDDSTDKLLAARTVRRHDFETTLRRKLKPFVKRGDGLV